LARLTEDLLKLSQMDAERLELELRPVSVAQLVESCYETARHQAAEKELNLSLDLPEGLPDVSGDARRLQEVLQNLLDNAIQYTLPGGKIVLSAEAKNEEVISRWQTRASVFRKPTSHGSLRGFTGWTWRAPVKRAARDSAGNRKTSNRGARRAHLGGKRSGCGLEIHVSVPGV